MANKKITDVDIVTSLDSDESFFINKNNAIKQISRNDVVFGISNGGTGATTAAGARNALGLGNTDGELPVENGGTGATTAKQARLNLGATSVYTTTVVLNVGGWSNNRQTVSIDNVDVSDMSNSVIIVSPNPSSHLEYSENGIYCIEQLSRELTFMCDSVPNVNVMVNVAIFS